jgi:hypothetical protein
MSRDLFTVQRDEEELKIGTRKETGIIPRSEGSEGGVSKRVDERRVVMAVTEDNLCELDLEGDLIRAPHGIYR